MLLSYKMQNLWLTKTPRHLLSTTILLTLNGCASLPAAPQGNTCVVDVANNGADCVSISTAIAYSGAIALVKKHATSFVPFPSMDNYIAFDPVTWGNIEIYIGELKQLAKTQCGQ